MLFISLGKPGSCARIVRQKLQCKTRHCLSALPLQSWYLGYTMCRPQGTIHLASTSPRSVHIIIMLLVESTVPNRA